MSIVIYYLETSPIIGGTVTSTRAEAFGMSEMSAALNRMQALRTLGRTHVAISVDNPDSVGKPGVDSVEDGKTPDGVDYTWKKRRP